MSLVQFEPIMAWPGPETSDRRGAPFRAPFERTMRQLDTELGHVITAGHRAALQVVTRNGAGDARKDGMLYARAVATHPGVRLSFPTPNGPLTFATDRYVSWQDNLRAITLGLEALRKVDRYGITQSGDQYAGWRAIEATAAVPYPHEVLLRWASHSPWNGEPRVFASDAALVRAARIGAHPDRHNGDHGPHREVAAAAKQLGVNL